MPDLDKWYYDLAYRLGKPRWDSGAVPSEVIALAASDHAHTALDLGCGTGTSAIYLAQKGLAVIGIDFTPKAIDAARDKAQRAGVTVDFRVGDVTRLDSLGVREPFDLVLDLGCFHGLDAAKRARYAEHVARLTHPGSVFLLWGFRVFPRFYSTFGMTPDQVQQQFAPHFAVNRIEQGEGLGKRTGMWYWLVRQNA
jgi:SAM-dependent methyltransferase